MFWTKKKDELEVYFSRMAYYKRLISNYSLPEHLALDVVGGNLTLNEALTFCFNMLNIYKKEE
jgi:hypothetical protein